MAITTTIPTNLDFPNRGVLERDAFVNAQETAQDLLAGGYTTALNQYAVEANQLEQNVTELESSTVASAALATSAANYKGEWASTTNYLVGQSVSYNGGLYLAKTSNINQIPSSNTYWLLNSLQLPINSIDELKTVSNIASVDVLGYYTKGDGGGGTFYWDATSTETDNGGTTIQATGVTTGRWKRVYSGAINVKWFGAKGDGVADDINAIQNAISNHNVVFIPEGVFIVSSQTAYLNGAIYGAGGLILKSGLTLFGVGDKSIIKVKNNAYGSGALYGIVRSDFINDVEIYNIKFDGNSNNQIASTQCSNVYLHAGDNINIHDCFSIYANGQGIQVVGKTTNPVDLLYIENNIVDTCTSIGIQVSHCNTPIIQNNIVLGCINNAIDIYNEDGDAIPSGKGGLVFGNTVNIALTGVFVETSAFINVANNSIYACTSSGIHINRINGLPSNCNINDNIINSSAYSVRISGVGSNNFVSGNTFSGFTTASILLYGTSCAGVIFTNNVIEFPNATTYFIETQNTAISNLQIKDNKCNGIYGGVAYKWLVTGTIAINAYFIQNPITINNTVQKDINSVITTITSGQTININVPKKVTGLLHLFGSSGGGWYSMATYTVISDNSTAKAIKINDTFIATGQLFGAITVSGLTLQVGTTATGSGGEVKYMLEYL